MPLRKSGKSEPIVWNYSDSERVDKANTGQMSAIIKLRGRTHLWFVATGNVFDYDNVIESGESSNSADARKKAEKYLRAGH